MPTNAINMVQVCQRLGLTKREVHARMQSDLAFPAPIRLAEGGIAFVSGEVSAYLAVEGAAC